jgi:hypothetical protein
MHLKLYDVKLEGYELKHRAVPIGVSPETVKSLTLHHIRNTRKSKVHTSKYMGVFETKTNKFKVNIIKAGVHFNGGTYQSEEVAGWARDMLVKELYGETALLNNVQLNNYVWVNHRAVKVDDKHLLENSIVCDKKILDEHTILGNKRQLEQPLENSMVKKNKSNFFNYFNFTK